ncbi:MAG: SMI1/KNR4 family protein [Pseudomonadota bacterium]
MTPEDFDYIEQTLSLQLPESFKKFIAPLPNDFTDTFLAYGEGYGIPTNPELFVIEQLSNFRNSFDPEKFYDGQRELVSHRFILIGADGCGNYYCVRGDSPDTEQVWFWDHEGSGFQILETDTLESFLSKCTSMKTENPFMQWQPQGKVITRADHPLRSVLNPITPDEWLNYVDSKANLELDEYQEATHPFTKEKIRAYIHQGRAKLIDHTPDAYFRFFAGRIHFVSDVQPDSLAERVIREIATDFSARIY